MTPTETPLSSHEGNQTLGLSWGYILFRDSILKAAEERRFSFFAQPQPIIAIKDRVTLALEIKNLLYFLVYIFFVQSESD